MPVQKVMEVVARGSSPLSLTSGTRNVPATVGTRNNMEVATKVVSFMLRVLIPSVSGRLLGKLLSKDPFL